MRRVKAEINRDGTVNLEFIGFVGAECSEERERLRDVLLGLGVVLEPQKITKKNNEQIALEIGAAKQQETRIDVGTR